MFVKRVPKSNGRIYLSIIESYRDVNKKPKARTVMKLGYLDDLEKEYENPIAHFEELAAKMTKEAKENRNVTITIDMNEELEYGLDAYNVGYLPYRHIYDELGLTQFFKSRSRSLNIEYSLDKILQLLVFSRIINPSSKKATYEERNFLFGNFDKITIDSIYSSLDYFYKFKDDILSLVWNKTKDAYQRDVSKSYYDCTNYYFEIECNDEDVFDENGNIIEKGLRKRGPEKNKRPDPIVEMGLLMDATGIPITYDLFPGNESEKTSLKPLINKSKINFGIGKTIVVADRGLNTSDNIFFLAGKNDDDSPKKDGYVYGQSVRGADKEFKDWVLKEDEYKITKVKENDEEIDFIHKSRIFGKEVKIKKNGKRTVKVVVYQKQMVYFSKKYQKKQRADREKMVAKAREMQKNPAAYTKATSYGAANYIKNLRFNQDTGEIIENNLVIDEEKIKEEEQFDGYYSIVTSEMELDDLEIRRIYRGLAKIEDTFKVSKSNLGARPAYVWTKEHIEGHFFTCFMALVLTRLLERKLEYKYPIGKIIESTRKCVCTSVANNIYKFEYRNEIIDAIEEKFNVKLTKKFQTKQEIKKILKY